MRHLPHQGDIIHPILKDLRAHEKVGEYVGVNRNVMPWVWVFNSGVGQLHLSIEGITAPEADRNEWIDEFAIKHKLPLKYVSGDNLYNPDSLFAVPPIKYEIKYQPD